MRLVCYGGVDVLFGGAQGSPGERLGVKSREPAIGVGNWASSSGGIIQRSYISDLQSTMPQNTPSPRHVSLNVSSS